MPDIFTPVIERLRELGAFKFLFPYMLTSAVFYGLLRKSQIFGKPDENVAVNAVVALIASFMVWASPVILGIDIETQLAAFFTQGLVVTLVFMVTLLIVGMFLPPDLPKHLAEGVFAGNKAAGILLIGVIMGMIIFATSGLWTVIVGPEMVEKATDVVLGVIVIVLLAIPIIFITYGGEKAPPVKEKKPEEGG
jgi:Na+-driven multidrug efflux pump